MIIFIDESGDPGFKFSNGSSSFFVIALLIFDDESVAEKTAISIKELRRNLKVSNKYEFKFNKCSKTFRKSFLETVMDFNFRVRAIVIDKRLIYSDMFKESKEMFYNFSLKQVLEKNNKTIKNAKIRLDGLGERTFRQSLTSYLRQNLNSKDIKILKNLKFRDSKNDVLIQLADMIAGTIHRKYTLKIDGKEYLNIIQKRIENIWEFK